MCCYDRFHMYLIILDAYVFDQSLIMNFVFEEQKGSKRVVKGLLNFYLREPHARILIQLERPIFSLVCELLIEFH